MHRIFRFIREKPLLAGGVVLTAAILIFAAQKTVFAPKKAPTYQTARAERGTIIATVTASGQVLSSNTLTISTTATGVVHQVFVKDGDMVTSGQKIAEINLDMAGQQKSTAAWSSYLSAKNSLDSANTSLYSLQSDMFAKWKTYTDLATNATYQNADGTANATNRILTPFTISQDDWLAAEAKYKNQQAVIRQSQAAVSAAWAAYQATSPVITAPTAGTIGNITLLEGLVLSGTAGTNVAVIQSDSLPLATFNISEIDIPNVFPGQKASITLDSLTGKTFAGTVKTVDRIGTITSNVTNYPVIVQFDATSKSLLPNMSATVAISTNKKDAVLLVPTSAVSAQNGQSIVRVMRNGKVTRVPVEIGLTSSTQTEIISGISEGDEVISGTFSGTQSSSSPFSRSGFGGGGPLRPGGFGGGR